MYFIATYVALRRERNSFSNMAGYKLKKKKLSGKSFFYVSDFQLALFHLFSADKTDSCGSQEQENVDLINERFLYYHK